jgi:putative flavoprotein involved in K+ transport
LKCGEVDQFAVYRLATGFKPALSHLHELRGGEPNGRILVRGTRSVREPLLWLIAYGDWTA